MLPAASDLSYFLEVSRTRNISRAAERLGIRQPSLSQAIQRLERAVGAPLLVRGRGGVQLTQAGSRFEVRARRLLEEWGRIATETARTQRELSGLYTVGCHVSVALYSLPEIAHKLLAEHPRLELRLIHDHSRKITEDVVSFKADFGVVVNPVEHPDLVVRPLFEDEVGLWVGPGRGGPLTQPRGGRACLICDPELAQTQWLLKQFRSKGMIFGRQITTSSLEVAAALVASGCGVGVLPTRVARRLSSLRLKPLGEGSPSFKDRICLVYRADLQRSEAARYMGKRLEEGLKAAAKGTS
ncbi:MAG TPA: LysR family transcriptional regulator [Bdellovibrionota bacterium]|jgi:DNA-binding transcriptional LysR family regulator|nr:LysR family transcriptional regulator [Bdellovibrionota bacterium]